MADTDRPVPGPETRQLLAALRESTRQDRCPDEVHEESLLEICDEPSDASGGRILLDAAGGHALLTAVEDSVETMLDILGEMQSLASPSECCRERVRTLRRELRDVMQSTRCEGMSLLDGSFSLPPLLVGLTPETTLRIVLDPPGAAVRSIASEEAFEPDLLAPAIAALNEYVERLAALRSRLRSVIEDQSLSERRRGDDAAHVDDADSARAQLRMVGRRIVSDSVEAFVAQASTETRLVDFLYRHGTANTLTRIYPLVGRQVGASHVDPPQRT